jgi:hypothetical protein
MVDPLLALGFSLLAFAIRLWPGISSFNLPLPERNGPSFQNELCEAGKQQRSE